ncbi:MAG: squalene synthase HpnC [Rhodospirillales bacterium]|nr:MAG: squalene synthase HpnC [Rhodospirillales bacterium]
MTSTAAAADPLGVETPSGKDAAYENFPVGSWLLPAALRPHVAVFYAFARAIDDIADNPDLAPEDKVRRLDGFEQALTTADSEPPGFAKACAMRHTLVATGITDRHCRDLIDAFKQDAMQSRYRTWHELIHYCNRSAAPVGRFLLDLHGGSRHGYGPCDALCNALQVINHLQDCADDYRTLDRVYLPLDWMDEAGAEVADLGRPGTTPALRRVIDRTLDHTETLLADAAPLPSGLASRRLALESAAILAIAWALVRRLRRRDPLARRVRLSKPEYLACCLRGAASVLV